MSDKDRVRNGRFGWKASSPTPPDQTAHALHQDLGVTSSLRP
ncbi:MAG: di-heme oxidoredictase family protein [Acidimicrobiia bacterium]